MAKYGKRMDSADLMSLGEALLADPDAVIAAEERRYHDAVDAVAAECAEKQVRVILLCGPSAAGKTTTSHRLCSAVEKTGRRVCRISLDDFYLPKDAMPTWEDGRLNYEAPDCLELDKFAAAARDLLTEGKAELPVYDFIVDRCVETIPTVCGPEDVIIVEGIHALNPAVTDCFAGQETMKIYIDTRTDFRVNGRTVLPTRMLRLCRRVLRDLRHRGSDATETLGLWHYVRRGEELYIHPYRDTADVRINTAHGYEPFLYCADLLDCMTGAGETEEDLEAVRTILRCAKRLRPIDGSRIPADSLIQEFIS